jgi:hypothetical protein
MGIFELGFLALMVSPSIVALIALPASRSRRRLVIALSVAIPVAGPILAVMVTRVRGTGKRIERGDLGEVLTNGVDVEQISRLGQAPALLELLMSDESADRQAALVVLSTKADADAIRTLRWAINHGGPETVLESALTVSELDYRFERAFAAVEALLEEQPSYEYAMAAANLLADTVHSGLADPAIAVGLAAQARELFIRAAQMPGAAAGEAEIQRARLELAMGLPLAAVELLDGVVQRRPEAHTEELQTLRNRARFSARLPPCAADPATAAPDPRVVVALCPA